LKTRITFRFSLGRHWKTLATKLPWPDLGKKASLLCRERDFDLIITDILMPEMDGLELIRSLHRSHSQLPPILAISGAYEGALKIAERFGAAGILKKPFGPDELFAKVNKILPKDEQQ
jgi:DNA-binding response OmpR family regulator